MDRLTEMNRDCTCLNGINETKIFKLHQQVAADWRMRRPPLLRPSASASVAAASTIPSASAPTGRTGSADADSSTFSRSD